jgi:geranylgeranyl pyrophosphate synthase
MLPNNRGLEEVEENPDPVTNKNNGAKREIRSIEELKGDFWTGSFSSAFLPDHPQLEDLLGLKTGSPISDLLKPVLLEPIRYLTDCPGKKIRGQLVRLGYEFANTTHPASRTDRQRCKLGAEVLEFLHAGSLVVDDIEDGSELRRGQPSLYRQFGLPVALNAGNWLYFWPFQLISDMGLSPEKELLIYRWYHRTLLRAHFGQALDVGLRINSLDQERIPGVCLASMELKTGALIAFSLVMGGILGGAYGPTLSSLDEFGHGLGILLQMSDDLGNLRGRRDPSKRFEDLKLRRPCWVWACAAENYPREVFEQFALAVGRLPEEKLLEEWIEKFAFMRTAKRQAEEYLDKIYRQLEVNLGYENCNEKALKRLLEVGRAVAIAYG